MPLKHTVVRRMEKTIRQLMPGRQVAIMENGALKFPDYEYRPQPRFGATTQPLGWLEARLDSQADRLLTSFDRCGAFNEGLAQIPLTAPEDSMEPRWLNPWFSGLDGVCLYGLARSLAPKLYMEIGSGNSTKFACRGIRDAKGKTRVVSVDPNPRVEIDDLCDLIHRTPLEAVQLSIFDELKAGDMLFFDGSHRAFQNSDVTVFFLEILPRLAPGVFVGIHDIFLPFDYPEDWTSRIYNEQHMLAAYLLGRRDVEMAFAAHWMSLDPRFIAKIDAMFAFDLSNQVQRGGGCFFFVN